MNEYSLETDSHYLHHEKWHVEIDCIACITEVLHEPSVGQSKKRYEVERLLRLLVEHREYLRTLLRAHVAVAEQISFILIDLLQINFRTDETCESLLVEGIIQILSILQNNEVCCGICTSVIHMCLDCVDYKENLPLFNLIGRIFGSFPQVVDFLPVNQGRFLEYLCEGLTGSDRAVVGSVSYICIQLWQKESFNSLLCDDQRLMLSDRVIHAVYSSTQSKLSDTEDVLLNLLGLLKTVFSDSTSSQALWNLVRSSDNTESCRPGVGSGDILELFVGSVKQLMVSSRSDITQISCVQCVLSLISSQSADWSQLLLQLSDITEVLLDTLERTTNDLLINSLYCCLLLLSDQLTFYTKRHSVYGMEYILKSLDVAMSNHHRIETKCNGLMLLANILQRSVGGSMRVFSNTAVMQFCLQIILKAIDLNLTEQASQVLANFLRRDHLLAPLPYKDVMNIMRKLIERPLVTLEQLHEYNTSDQLQNGTVSITSIVQLVLQCSRLISECDSSDHSCLDDSAFAGPAAAAAYTECGGAAEPVGVKQFTDWTVSFIQEFCLPNTLMCDEEYNTDNDSMYSNLLSALNLLYKSSAQVTHELDVELFTSNILDKLIQLKTLSRLEEVQRNVVELLHEVLCVVLKGDEQFDILSNRIRSGLSLIQGENMKHVISVYVGRSRNISELHSVRSEENVYCIDDCDRDLGYVIVILLYLLYRNDNRLIDGGDVVRSVITYLQVSGSDNNERLKIPATLVKMCIYLLAEADESTTVDCLYRREVSSLISTIEDNLSNVDTWCMESHKILGWVFRQPEVCCLCGEQVLLQYITLSHDKEIIDLISRNSVAMKSTLSLCLTSEENVILSRVVRIFKKLFSQDMLCDQLRRSSVISVISDTAQRLLLLKPSNVPAENMCVFLELLTILHAQELVDLQSKSATNKQSSYQFSISVQQLKLADYVIKLLEYRLMKDGMTDDVTVAVWNRVELTLMSYLNILLQKALLLSDNRVCLVVTQSDTVYKYIYLTHQYRSHMYQSVIISLSIMLLSLSFFSLQTDHMLELDVMMTQMLEGQGLLTRGVSEGVARVCLCFSYWTRVRGWESSVRRGAERSVKRGAELGQRGGAMSEELFRSLYLDLLNSLIIESPVLNTASCLSLYVMMTRAMYNKPGLRRHLLGQPWTGFVLKLLMNRATALRGRVIEGASAIPVTALTLMLLILEIGGSLDTTHECLLVEDLSHADPLTASLLHVWLYMKLTHQLNSSDTKASSLYERWREVYNTRVVKGQRSEHSEDLCFYFEMFSVLNIILVEGVEKRISTESQG